MISAEAIRSSPALVARLPIAKLIRGFWRFTICNSVLLNAVLAITSLFLLNRGLLQRSSVSSALSAAGLYFFRGRQGTDSWAPMLDALQYFFSGQPIYQTTFFVKNIKFQYPLPSLLPLYVLTKAGFGNETILVILNLVSWFAVCVTIAVSYWILRRCLQRRVGELMPTDALSLGALVAVSGIFFYPLVKGYSQGQIQCVVDVFFALGLYSWIRRKEAVSGVLIGFMCLIKPQYSIIVLWFALRKKFSALAASVFAAAIGFIGASLVFGWREQFAYSGVLSYMMKHGETFFENQSVNGLLHRLLMHGNSLKWEPNAFAPYSPFVYALSLISSLGLLAVGLFYPKFSKNGDTSKDFALIALVATMASPIVWEHHYGIVLPICAYFAGSLTRGTDLRWLGAVFILTGSSWTPLNIFAKIPGLNVLQSLPLLGAVLLLLLFFRSKLPGPQCPPAAFAIKKRFGSLAMGTASAQAGLDAT